MPRTLAFVAAALFAVAPTASAQVNDVATRERKGQGLCLDRGAAREAGFLDAAHQVGGKIEGGEGEIGEMVFGVFGH